jgi:hypothetical protein
MRLCMLVIMQDTSRISLYESPIIHYLAVQGLDEQRQSLRSSSFLNPHFGGHVMDQPIDHIGSSSAITGMGRIRIEERGRG